MTKIKITKKKLAKNKMQNIFNKKPRTKNLKKIIVDHREKNSLVPSKLLALGIPIEFKQLKVADYLIEDIAVERKTFQDFISSMINKRLLRQLEDLKQYPKPLLIIEGFSKDIDMEINPNAIKGFILSISLSHKIPIIFTESTLETAEYLGLISKKKQTSMSLNISKKNLTNKQQLQFIMESFPKIGPKTSEKLLKHFKSIKNIILASEQELEIVLGKKAAEIFTIINKNF